MQGRGVQRAAPVGSAYAAAHHHRGRAFENAAPFTGPPMDLDNMRSFVVTNVDVYCGCGDQASVEVSKLPGDLAVPDVRLRLLLEMRRPKPGGLIIR
jgi:hypothetical protein